MFPDPRIRRATQDDAEGPSRDEDLAGSGGAVSRELCAIYVHPDRVGCVEPAPFRDTGETKVRLRRLLA